ncbi:MAG: class I adenylate-forming enzyme family protein [Gammaproteobacteria bacterium]
MVSPINVTDFVAARAASDSAWPALFHPSGTQSYGEMLARADAIAARLRSVLHDPVPRVALMCPNGPDYVALALGVLRAGACLVPVAGELALPERMTQLALTAPQVMLAAGPEPWVPHPGVAETIAGIDFSWCALTAMAAFPEDRFCALNPAFVRFSSGTTADSKGVVLGHETLLARVRSANRRLKITSADRVLWTLPMAHHFAVSIMLYLLEGAGIVLEDSHLASELLTAARARGATVFYGPPFHLALLAAEDSGRAWPALRLAVSTAFALPEATAVAFARRYGVWPAQGFGIIEAGLPLLNTDAACAKPLSVGRPDDCALRLRDERGADVAPGEIGELCLRGPGMFDAYLAPWCERAAATDDGWFATGDLASQDEDGHVFLRGRRKSVINFGGIKFFPEEVEEVLNAHPAVRESRVSGEPHERWGAVAVAEIVARDSSQPPKVAALVKYCRARLAGYKVPVRFRLVVELPRTASGKLRR